MAILTRRLRLKRHTRSDVYRVQDYSDNWQILDANPGTFICTSATRPTTWGISHAGRRILEEDTGLEWRWTGSQFVRLYPVGELGSADRTSQAQTSSTNLQVAVSLDVLVPPGGRSVMVNASGPGVYSTVGLTRLALFRGSTQIQSWLSHGRLTSTATDQPRPVHMAIQDTPQAGAQTYTLRYSAEIGYGGTSTLQAALDKPLRLTVVEV